ncbi:MAG: hypothetical protein LBS79_05345 [Tannerella sp.]|nr:hypothetical protein [Tannerella sp.]
MTVNIPSQVSGCRLVHNAGHMGADHGDVFAARIRTLRNKDQAGKMCGAAA